MTLGRQRDTAFLAMLRMGAANGFKPQLVVDNILNVLRDPGKEPNASERNWLKVIGTHVTAEFGDAEPDARPAPAKPARPKSTEVPTASMLD